MRRKMTKKKQRTPRQQGTNTEREEIFNFITCSIFITCSVPSPIADRALASSSMINVDFLFSYCCAAFAGPLCDILTFYRKYAQTAVYAGAQVGAQIAQAFTLFLNYLQTRWKAERSECPLVLQLKRLFAYIPWKRSKCRKVVRRLQHSHKKPKIYHLSLMSSLAHCLQSLKTPNRWYAKKEILRSVIFIAKKRISTVVVMRHKTQPYRNIDIYIWIYFSLLLPLTFSAN